MMFGFRALALLGGLALAIPAAAGAAPVGPDGKESGWETLSDANGVRVLRRSVAGSPLKSMKGVAVIDAPVARVALVLIDEDRAGEWVNSLAEARVVRQVSAHEYLQYTHVALPPLLHDRDFVTRVTLSSDPLQQRAIIDSASAIDPAAAPRARIVRGELTAHYEMQAIDGGRRTRLTIELHCDPKGLLPSWLVNLFQRDWARLTIAGIRRQVNKPDLTVPATWAAYLGELAFPVTVAAH